VCRLRGLLMPHARSMLSGCQHSSWNYHISGVSLSRDLPFKQVPQTWQAETWSWYLVSGSLVIVGMPAVISPFPAQMYLGPLRVLCFTRFFKRFCFSSLFLSCFTIERHSNFLFADLANVKDMSE
jgi:hypothetical protein